jgi:hypothetical protein
MAVSTPQLHTYASVGGYLNAVNVSKQLLEFALPAAVYKAPHSPTHLLLHYLASEYKKADPSL